MEHLTDTEQMMAGALRLHSPEADEVPKLAEPDPGRSWLRLDEVAISPRAPIQSFMKGSMAPALAQLRTQLRGQMRTTNAKRLAITAASRGAGASMIAAGLALTFAKQQDLKVIFADLNMRKPRAAKILGLTDTAPIMTLLEGTPRDFASRGLRVGTNFGLALALEPTDAPAERLAMASSAKILDAIEDTYAPHLMIFDLPPVLDYDDFASASPLFDAGVLVAKCGETALEQIDLAEQRIRECSACLGIVANAAP